MTDRLVWGGPGDGGSVEAGQPHTTDERLQRRIAAEPWLRWKSHNTRRRLAARPVGVHIRRYQPDNSGWEVASIGHDSPPRPLSGPHPTLKEAEGARDFLVGLLNAHPKLHIMGPDPQPSHQVPTVRVFSHAPNEPWYLLCLNTEGTVDAISPPYPTRQAATHTLEQLGLLHAATATPDIGNRAVAAPTSTSCQCSLKGWRCEHTELSAPETEPPNRGHGLSLWSDDHERGL